MNRCFLNDVPQVDCHLSSNIVFENAIQIVFVVFLGFLNHFRFLLEGTVETLFILLDKGLEGVDFL